MPTPTHLNCRLQCVTAHFTKSQTGGRSTLRPTDPEVSVHLILSEKSHIGTHLPAPPMSVHGVLALIRTPSKINLLLHPPIPDLLILPHIPAHTKSHHHVRTPCKSFIRHLLHLYICPAATPSPMPTRSIHHPCGNTHPRHIITRDNPTDLIRERLISHLRGQGNHI